MYVETLDRGMIRKAVSVMANLALDGLAAHEVDELDPDTIAFIKATLNGVIGNKENDRVTGHFGVFDLARLSEIRIGFDNATLGVIAPRVNVVGKVKLTEEELRQLKIESDGLRKLNIAVGARLEDITRALVNSGEVRLHEMRHIQTWYYDGENTHGISGLASVGTERTETTVGIGPDHTYVGTAEELVTYLRAAGYTEIETDVDSLRLAWQAQFDN